MITDIHRNRGEHPLDVVERLASDKDFAFDREHRDEIAIETRGASCDYHVAFTWLSHVEALHVACAFDLVVPEPKRGRVLELMSLVNEQLWVGHFDLWTHENVVMFRQALVLAGGAEAQDAQCAAILRTAVETCDRFHQAFHFVVWGGMSPKDAFDAALMEPLGNA